MMESDRPFVESRVGGRPVLEQLIKQTGMTEEAKLPWPTEIRLRPDRNSLVVGFDDGRSYTLSAEYLRVLSPSAEVQGHSPEQRKTVGVKKSVLISAVDPVGNYAVRLTFDDGHNTGLFSWRYLHELGANHQRKWTDYLADLKRTGQDREA